MTGVAVEVVRLKTADGANVAGVLRRPAHGADTVVSIMHPREDVTHHPLVEPLLDIGVAVWTQTTRSPNNDVRLVHEQAILDVAAGQAFLEGQDFEATVALGHSGGATLFAFYQEQAALAPGARLTTAPDGSPVDLAAAQMPVPDGAVFMAPHPGQGALLQRVIDPAVLDESDPWTTDPTLDAFAETNGFRPAPESSAYSPEFITRYRAAQVERIRRIDALAASALAEAQYDHTVGGLDARRRSLRPTIMTVHRTDADLRSMDMSIDPNRRPYGSLFGRPDLGNFGFAGFGRITTPSAWMSTWSPTTTRASFVSNVRSVTAPTLLIELTGDQACFPADARGMYAALAASDKKHVRVAGTHFGGPISANEPTGTQQAAQQIGRWLEERFPLRAKPAGR